MFDYLRCDYPLPRPEMQKCTFQTKDLDCSLDEYTIHADGRLTRLDSESRWIDVADGFMGGYFETIEGSERETEIDYHGDIHFYDVWPPGETNAPLIQFQARVTEGRVQWIRERTNS